MHHGGDPDGSEGRAHTPEHALFMGLSRLAVFLLLLCVFGQFILVALINRMAECLQEADGINADPRT